jgi:hypothetical protein
MADHSIVNYTLRMEDALMAAGQSAASPGIEE